MFDFGQLLNMFRIGGNNAAGAIIQNSKSGTTNVNYQTIDLTNGQPYTTITLPDPAATTPAISTTSIIITVASIAALIGTVIYLTRK